MGSGLDVEMVEFRIAAAASHLGANAAGHYRTALRVCDTVTDDTVPYRWLVTDDDKPHALTWHLPAWLLQNVTTVWLTRMDGSQFPDHFQSPLDESTGAMVIQDDMSLQEALAWLSAKSSKESETVTRTA